MKPTRLIALIVTILTASAWADGPGGPTTQPHTLPADPKTPVITLAIGKSQVPLFQVFSDGSAIAQAEHGVGQPVSIKGKLTPDEIQGLLYYALDDLDFADIKSANLPQRTKEKSRGLDETRTITISADGEVYQCRGLPWATATKRADKASAVGQFVNLIDRLEHTQRVVLLGGDDAFTKILATVNAKVKARFPDEPPMQESELREVVATFDGGEQTAFMRNEGTSNGRVNWIIVNVTIDPKGHVQVNVGTGSTGSGSTKSAGH